MNESNEFSNEFSNDLVPIVVENTGKGERSFDLFSRLLKDRVIFLNGGIDDTTSKLIVAQLLFLESEDSKKDINLYINSPGGHVTSALAILDTMNFIKPDVSTLVLGQACSAGALLLNAGAKGKRLALPNSRVMIHQVLGGFRGQGTDVQIHAKEMQVIKDKLNQLMADNSGVTFKEMEKATDRDNFMSPEQAVKFGLIDSIVQKR